jgi:hypothetical protein
MEVDYRPDQGKNEPVNYFSITKDGYSVYKEFVFRQGIGSVGCIAHIRRYYEKAIEENKPETEYVLMIIYSL